jgi:hypothetical protein
MKILILTVLTFFISSVSLAGDDPSIKGQLRTDIKKAMEQHVKSNTINGDYVLYDAITGNLLHLQLEELHSGIVSKGDFYVSCADFKDASDSQYDIDFMVAGSKDNLRVFQALVHKDKEGKREYHLEN